MNEKIRVRLTGGHPHSGRIGHVETRNGMVTQTSFGGGDPMVKVEFDDGSACYAAAKFIVVDKEKKK